MPAPRGVPQIEVTFDIDANGILSVTAKDKGTGKEQSITITGASTLPKEEVEQLVKEAEQNANIDKEKREQIDLENQADSLCYQCQNQLSELGDKVKGDTKTNIQNKIDTLRDAIKNHKHDEIKVLQNDLQQSMMNISKEMSDNNQKNSDTSNNSSANDTVIDTNSKEA